MDIFASSQINININEKVFTLFSHQPVYGIIASSNFYQKDSITQSNLYRQYKSEFEQYEKQHGKYIQTNNTKMHYLEWEVLKSHPYLDSRNI